MRLERVCGFLVRVCGFFVDTMRKMIALYAGGSEHVCYCRYRSFTFYADTPHRCRNHFHICYLSLCKCGTTYLRQKYSFARATQLSISLSVHDDQMMIVSVEAALLCYVCYARVHATYFDCVSFCALVFWRVNCTPSSSSRYIRLHSSGR